MMKTQNLLTNQEQALECELVSEAQSRLNELLWDCYGEFPVMLTDWREVSFDRKALGNVTVKNRQQVSMEPSNYML
jgi:hypothetical protein